MQGEEDHGETGAGRQQHADPFPRRRERLELAAERKGGANEVVIGERLAVRVLQDDLCATGAGAGLQQRVPQRLAPELRAETVRHHPSGPLATGGGKPDLDPSWLR
jgi:hypothetical protein